MIVRKKQQDRRNFDKTVVVGVTNITGNPFIHNHMITCEESHFCTYVSMCFHKNHIKEKVDKRTVFLLH